MYRSALGAHLGQREVADRRLTILGEHGRRVGRIADAGGLASEPLLSHRRKTLREDRGAAQVSWVGIGKP